MNELESSLKNYNETLSLANLSLDDVPNSVRSGREAQKRQAQAGLEDAKALYATNLKKSAFGMVIAGPGANKFVDIAKEEAEVLTVDAMAMYRRIADRVAPAMGSNRDFGVSHYSTVIQELRVIAEELGIDSMPSPIWSEPVAVGSAEGLLKHIQSMVESSVGLDLLALYVNRQMTNAGLVANSDKNTVPVLLTGLEVATAEALLPKAFHEGRTSLVVTDENVNKEVVLEAFDKVKKQIKNIKKKN